MLNEKQTSTTRKFKNGAIDYYGEFNKRLEKAGFSVIKSRSSEKKKTMKVVSKTALTGEPLAEIMLEERIPERISRRLRVYDKKIEDISSDLTDPIPERILLKEKAGFRIQLETS